MVENQLETVFKLEIQNPRIIIAEASSKMVKECIVENVITELNHSSGVSIKLNDEIIVDNILYKAEKIKKEITENSNKARYKIVNYELSKTSQFILPLLGLTSKELLRDELLCNAYIGYKDDSHSTYGNYIYLLYRCHEEASFHFVEDLLLDLGLGIVTEFANESLCLLRVDIPERFKADVQIFLKGKYSQVSKEAKFCIIEYYKANSKSLIHQVLYKSDERRKILEEVINDILPDNAELFSSFDEREIYYNYEQ